MKVSKEEVKMKQLKVRLSAELLDEWNELHKFQATSGSEILRRFMKDYISKRTNFKIDKYRE